MNNAATRPHLLRRGVIVAALVGVGIVGWYVFVHENSSELAPNREIQPDPPTPDPRLTYDTPFRNVKPDVRYVGDAACAGCHVDIDKSYHAHPMGRSAELVSRASPIERYDAAAHNPTTVGPFELFVDKSADRVLHRVRAKDSTGKPLPDYVTTAYLAIGSGTRGRSYLSYEQGAAWQTPISWYGPDARWDLSPGFDLGRGGRRAILAECLHCHVHHVEPVEGTINSYKEPFPVLQASIGCERCHGPGELHVAERSAGPIQQRIDTSIVNPKHLSPELQASICAQCHLQGEERVARRGRNIFEYRPGLPLELFVTVYVRHPSLVDYRKSVGQFEQMHQSKCFIGSGGRLSCASCHDPHAVPKPAEKEMFYRGRCQSCHTPDKMCAEQLDVRQAKGDSCITCHMSRADSSNIVHTSVSDHRVPRRPLPSKSPHGLNPGDDPLIAFPIGKESIPDTERDRDFGIALARVIANVGSDPVGRNMVASLAENRLSATLARWPGDLPAWISMCQAKEARGDRKGYLEAATTAARLAPRSEVAQNVLATAAATNGENEIAIAAATEVIRLSPTSAEPRLLRAGVYIQARDWKNAEADCRAALAIHPLYPRGRAFLAICRHQQGDLAGARKELDTALNLSPKLQQKSALLEMYNANTR
jgi:cytochrome c-type biogenesis protein CcmH/NrfG